jgi:hypothetical protein
MNAKTSDRISSLAGRYATLTDTEVLIRCRAGQAEELAADIRSMAASLLKQDEHKGLRGKLKLVLGR